MKEFEINEEVADSYNFYTIIGYEEAHTFRECINRQTINVVAPAYLISTSRGYQRYKKDIGRDTFIKLPKKVKGKALYIQYERIESIYENGNWKNVKKLYTGRVIRKCISGYYTVINQHNVRQHVQPKQIVNEEKQKYILLYNKLKSIISK